MKKDEPMRNINPFGLRLQPALKAKLEEAAASNKRSLNAEISARLEESFIPRTMDDIELGSLSRLERELADMSIESFKLAHEVNSIQEMMNKASDPESRPLLERMTELAPQIARLEALKHQRMQAIAAIKHFEK